MKTLRIYLECGEGCSTPANTMGMGNPGETSPDTLSEPVGGVEKTAKSEVEKERKRKKKKIKSLSESLFDDNVKKSITFGDVLELEGWQSSDINDYPEIDLCFNRTFSAQKIQKLITSPKWKKFLSPHASSYQQGLNGVDNPELYIENYVAVILTWVIMCCENIGGISNKLNEFIKETRDTTHRHLDHYCNNIQVFPMQGIGDMKDFPRLVTFKLKCRESEYIIYAKLKKRD